MDRHSHRGFDRNVNTGSLVAGKVGPSDQFLDSVSAVSGLVPPVSDLVSPVSDLVSAVSDLVSAVSDPVSPVSGPVSPVSGQLSPDRYLLILVTFVEKSRQSPRFRLNNAA